MKKVILSLAAVFAFGFASAQDLTSKKGEPYLPQAGDWSISFDAGKALHYLGNTFNGNTDNDTASLFGKSSEIGFVGKRFVTDTYAIRYTANFNLNYASEKQGSTSNSSTVFGLTAGIGKEWRKGTTRLQGFYGADALLSFQNPAEKVMAFGVGVQGFVGAEYFIFPKFSLGAQYQYGVGLGYSSNNSGTVDTSSFNFNVGKAASAPLAGDAGVGVASVFINLYF